MVLFFMHDHLSIVESPQTIFAIMESRPRHFVRTNELVYNIEKRIVEQMTMITGIKEPNTNLNFFHSIHVSWMLSLFQEISSGILINSFLKRAPKERLLVKKFLQKTHIPLSIFKGPVKALIIFNLENIFNKWRSGFFFKELLYFSIKTK